MDDAHSPLATFLRDFRSQRHLTIQELAEVCQLSIATLMDAEAGLKPAPDALKAIAAGLEVSVEELLLIANGGRQVSLTTRSTEPRHPEVPDGWASSALPSGAGARAGVDRGNGPAARTVQGVADAASGLSPAQLEQVFAYIDLLKLAERGRHALEVLVKAPDEGP